MELKCPQCGKWMAVSQEELVIHDCQVVCPQCLAVCQYEGGVLVVRDDSDAPYRHNAVVESDKPSKNKTFCHSCGKKLPEGISFCPYCGADLGAPFKPVEPQPVTAPEPVREPEPVKSQPVEEAPIQERPAAEDASRSQSTTGVEDKLRTMAHHYNTMHPHLHQHGTMPSQGFKIFAYITIALLLILLIYIIYAGASIESIP